MTTVEDIFELHGWRFRCVKAPISNSATIEKFDKELGIRSPEMVHYENLLLLEYPSRQLRISFNARDALLLCKHQSSVAEPKPEVSSLSAPNEPNASVKESPASLPSHLGPVAPRQRVQVRMAKHWSNYASSEAKELEMNFDWTYTTDYRGTLEQIRPAGVEEQMASLSLTDTARPSGFRPPVVTETDSIPIELIRRRDAPIRWYDEVVLFEDELHDNGISSLSVKVRVMDNFFLCLLRFWLRVDGVLVRVYDTRVFHEFGKSYVLREFQAREETFEELRKRGMPTSPSDYRDPNIFANKLALKFGLMEKIELGPFESDVAAAAAAAPAPSAASSERTVAAAGSSSGDAR